MSLTEVGLHHGCHSASTFRVVFQVTTNKIVFAMAIHHHTLIARGCQAQRTVPDVSILSQSTPLALLTYFPNNYTIFAVFIPSSPTSSLYTTIPLFTYIYSPTSSYITTSPNLEPNKHMFNE